MVAPGQTPGQPDAPADESRARADKTRAAEGQMRVATGRETRSAEGEPDLRAKATGKRGGARGSRSRPSAGGKRTKTKRKAGVSGGAARGAKKASTRKAAKRAGTKTGGGRKKATGRKAPKAGASKGPTRRTRAKTRKGSGKAGGKRSR